MSDSFLRRKAQIGTRLEPLPQTEASMSLLRVMFGLPKEGDTQVLDAQGIAWEGPDYSPKEFMAFLNTSQWSIYKWLDPDSVTNFPVPALFGFIEFVRAKSNGADHRLAAYVANLSGYAEKVRKIIEAVEGR